MVVNLRHMCHSGLFLITKSCEKVTITGRTRNSLKTSKQINQKDNNTFCVEKKIVGQLGRGMEFFRKALGGSSRELL